MCRITIIGVERTVPLTYVNSLVLKTGAGVASQVGDILCRSPLPAPFATVHSALAAFFLVIKILLLLFFFFN